MAFLHLPMAYPWLATHTLAGLCALWLPSGASTSEKIQHSAKPPPPKPPAQPGQSTQCKLHHTCCTLQRLNLTLQWPMACPGLATHTLPGLCPLWLLSGISASGKLQQSAKPYPPQSTCPAQLQHPVQAPPHLLHTAEAAFDLAVARAGHSFTGKALCAVVANLRFHSWKTPALSKTAPPTNHLPSPAAALSAGCTISAVHYRGKI